MAKLAQKGKKIKILDDTQDPTVSETEIINREREADEEVEPSTVKKKMNKIKDERSDEEDDAALKEQEKMFMDAKAQLEQEA